MLSISRTYSQLIFTLPQQKGTIIIINPFTYEKVQASKGEMTSIYHKPAVLNVWFGNPW